MISLEKKCHHEEKRCLTLRQEFEHGKERYSKLLDLSPSAVGIECGGKIIMINKSGIKLFEARGQRDIVGRSLLKFVETEDQEALRIRFSDNLETGNVYPPLEAGIVTVKGNKVIVQITSATVVINGAKGILFGICDISKLKSAENKLSIYYNIVSASRECMAFIDNNGFLTAANESLCSMLNLPLKSVEGSRLTDVIKPHVVLEPGGIADLVERSLCGESIHTEIWIVSKGNDYILMELNMVPFSSEKTIKGCVLNMRDITGSVQAETKMLKASQKVREQIGSELHDGLTHQLLGIAVKGRILAKRLEKLYPEGAEMSLEIERLLNQAIDETRRLAHGLLPSHLEHISFTSALDDMRDIILAYGIECEVELDASIVLNSEIKMHFYYILQEAINNIIRHSKASFVKIGFNTQKEFINLSIRDNGCGLSAESIEKSGVGFQIMRSRARLLGASLEIREAPGGGTEIRCMINRTSRTRSTID